MKTSGRGLALIREFEGLILEAYPDPGSRDGFPWTIGIGTTVGVKPGMVITEKQAYEFLARDIVEYETAVEKATAGCNLNQNQFDALVCLTYNIGVAKFLKSTVLRMILKGDYAAAANAFGMWIKNDGKVLKGLVRRRAAEKALFLREEGPSAGITAEAPESALKPTSTSSDSLLKSKNVAAGATAIGSGGILNLVDTNTLSTVKSGAGDFKTEVKQSNVIYKDYIIQGVSFLIIILGAFIIWKRFMDRKQGIK